MEFANGYAFAYTDQKGALRGPFLAGKASIVAGRGMPAETLPLHRPAPRFVTAGSAAFLCITFRNLDCES